MKIIQAHPTFYVELSPEEIFICPKQGICSSYPIWLGKNRAIMRDVISYFENYYTVTMANEQNNTWSIDNKDNIILGYAKENTLNPGVSPLYYHATGLAFEGYYYTGGTGTGVRCIYYYFIRHQGEDNDAYQAYTNETINTEATKALTCPNDPAMNFGIVRNNIYRISIDKITEDMKIKVKMWDTFTHSVIYM